jgi:hypothetical protein
VHLLHVLCALSCICLWNINLTHVLHAIVLVKKRLHLYFSPMLFCSIKNYFSSGIAFLFTHDEAHNITIDTFILSSVPIIAKGRFKN